MADEFVENDKDDDFLGDFAKWTPILTLAGMVFIGHQLFMITQQDDRRYHHPTPYRRVDDVEHVPVERTRKVVYHVPESIVQTLEPNKKYIEVWDPTTKKHKIKDLGQYYSRLGDPID